MNATISDNQESKPPSC